MFCTKILEMFGFFYNRQNEFKDTKRKRLRETVRRKKPQWWKSHSWVLDHDNAPNHSLFLVRNFLAKNERTVVAQPPYSPDLALAD